MFLLSHSVLIIGQHYPNLFCYLLQGAVGVLAVVRGVGHYGHVEEEGALEELPHVVRGVDLLHLNLGVDVAVRQEVDIGVLHLHRR